MRTIRIPAVHYRSEFRDEIVEHGTEARARLNAQTYGMTFVWVERKIPSLWDRIRGVKA